METILLYADSAVFDVLYIQFNHATSFHGCSKFLEEFQPIQAVDASQLRRYLCKLASSSSTWERSSAVRQLLSFFLLTWHVLRRLVSLGDLTVSLTGFLRHFSIFALAQSTTFQLSINQKRIRNDSVRVRFGLKSEIRYTPSFGVAY